MNQRILSTLGFDKVKQQLLQFIVTAQGTNEVSELLPIADENKIQAWLNETGWFKSSTITWWNPHS